MWKGSHTNREFFDGRHRFEHWYRDNTVYFITARCRDRVNAFAQEPAKLVFWDRFEHYTKQHGFVPFVTTLLDNHCHTLGYLSKGCEFREMMRKLHGSVAKLVNDTLPLRHVPFWRDAAGHDYFDGCIRDVLQLDRAYRYTLLQAVRAGICHDYRSYPHTHLNVELTRAIARSVERRVFLETVPYARYERRRDR